MNLYTYPVQSKDVQFNQTETTLVTAALTLRAKERNRSSLNVEAGDGSGGDQVDISPEARALTASSGTSSSASGSSASAPGALAAVTEKTTAETGLSASGQSEDSQSGGSVTEQAKERVQKRIREVQQQLRQVQGDATLSKEEKDKRVQELQTELLSLMNELQQQGGGAGYTGGTVAQGMAQSLT